VLNFNKKLELVDWLLKFHLKRFLGVRTGIQSVGKCSCQLGPVREKSFLLIILNELKVQGQNF